jgi:hypothetical protein
LLGVTGSRVGQRLASQVHAAVAVEPFGEILDGASEDLCGLAVPSERREAAGRGLLLVQTLSKEWGCEVLETGGKVVW